VSLIKTNSFEIAVYAKGDPGAKKLALVIPGRLDTKDYISLTSLVDMLAEKGFYAVGFDPPGTWESPGGIEIYSTTNTLKATNELIEHFGNRPTILIGHSRGGANAMLAGTKNPQVTHFAAIFSHAGPTRVELPTDGQPVRSERDLPPGDHRTKEKKIFRLPVSYFEDQEHYDATEVLKTCTKPKLFFYGLHDVLVTPETVQHIYNKAAEPKEIKSIDTEHDYRLHPEAIQQVNQAVSDFLDEYLL
jgi:putative redox protein